MMLTTKGRYAVMAMVDLANNGKGKPLPLSDIASRQDITLAYLEQIFSRLKAGQLVKSVRGPGGGYLLSRPVDKINIAEIITAVNEPIKMTRCDHNPDKGCTSTKARCLTHDLWDGLGNHIYSYLNSVTLDDICSRKLNVKPQLFATDPEKLRNLDLVSAN